MSNVTASGIVTPDEGNTLDPEVYLAAMAESIEEGIGERLNKQEQAIGLAAGIAIGTTVGFAPGIIAPYEILTGEECFTQGMTLEGGIVTLTVPGMYFISCSAALETIANEPANAGRTIALQIYKNGVQLAGCEVEANADNWSTAQANKVVNCIAGDELAVHWYSAGGAGVGTLAPNTPMNTLSIVLVTPIGV